MVHIYPDYYKSFKCIASSCRHNCCIGWEIDIDLDTYERYINEKGSLGDRLRKHTSAEPVPHFICQGDGRCPFLNGRGLCDIITELGEDALCGICDAHPRFVCELPSRTEHGLGLCCEEAARLIILKREPVSFISDGDTSTEDEVILLRDRVISIFQKREKTVRERCREALSECNISLPRRTPAEWAEFFLTLERLDSSWETILNGIREGDFTPDSATVPDYMWENLLVYLVYRHMASAPDCAEAALRCAFAVLSFEFLSCAARLLLLKNGSFGEADMTELCRIYSAEVEYSPENTDCILDELSFLCETEP